MKAWNRKTWIAIIMAIVLAVVIYPPMVLTEIHVNFEDPTYSTGDHWRIFTSHTENLKPSSMRATYEKDGEAAMFFWDFLYRGGRTLKRMDPMDYNYDNIIEVSSMDFYINGFYAGQLKGQQLLESFTSNEQVDIYETETGALGLVIKGEDSQLLMTESFREYYVSIAKTYARTGVLYLIPMLAAAVFVVEFYRRKIWSQRDGRGMLAVDTLLYVVGVSALVLILIGSFVGTSKVNPDETESIYSVQYYFNHWIIPDMRDLELEAFSQYGTARLFELDLYYVLAAQIARFFTFEHATRFFGVVLAGGIFYFLFSNLKKHRYLLCVFFLTPQIWYLYTYCTSDALDFAVGVLVLYQLANPQSMLHRLADQGVTKKDVWQVLLLGFLFSNIFMSKQNYYVFAIYAFLILLVDLFAADREKRKDRFVCYLWIAGTALLCLAIRYIPEFYHYGIHKQQVILEMQNLIAIPELRPASPPEVQSPAFNMIGKGVTLKELLFQMGFHTTLFRSFVGTYGTLQFPSPQWYNLVMGGLYVVFCLAVSVSVLRQKGQTASKVKLGMLVISGLVSYALVIYNAWFIDFQAQGRYMLPVLIFAAHAAALNPQMCHKKWFQAFICVTAVLSLYSFAGCCIPNIMP